MRTTVRTLAALTAAVAVVLVTVASAIAREPTNIPPQTCFWSGLIVSRISAYNFAFPDTGATYWTAQVQMPAGSTLILHGQFTHVRYQSLNSYDSAAQPTDALNDVSTRPDPGAHNPFLPGALRTVKNRSYTITVLDEPAPITSSARRPNTLYAGVPGDAEQRIIYRVYVPDQGESVTGGEPLPNAELRLADGQLLTGTAACDAMDATPGPVPLATLSPTQYDALRDQPGKPATFPASDPVSWQRFYTPAFTLGCLYEDACSGTPTVTGGQYSNKDIAYVLADANRGLGKVLVLHGKLPTTPDTQDGARRMGRGQMRYWSLCQNQAFTTTKGGACLDDAQVPIDRHREYTIVSSRPGDRPANATLRCGVAFLPWSRQGDGDGHLNEQLLILRNMLPSPSFHHAVQDVSTPGQTAKMMGPYLPHGTYTSTTKFQKLGCHPR